jgi:uncharacterized damage-inducible protein DinB
MTPQETEIRRRLLLDTLESEHQLMLEVAGAIPDDRLDWRPDWANARSAAELAFHTAGAGAFFLQLVDGLPSGPDDGASPAFASTDALVTAMQSLFASYEERVREYPLEVLIKSTSFLGKDFPNVDVLSWHPYHLVHHRGQLTMYLRMMGARVPATYGPSGDEDYTQ